MSNFSPTSLRGKQGTNDDIRRAVTVQVAACFTPAGSAIIRLVPLYDLTAHSISSPKSSGQSWSLYRQ